MMLCQRVEEFRRETMLQNYNESFPELRYPQLHMAPSSEFNSLVQHTDQPWYNNYHNGLSNGGGDYYSSRGAENKTPTEWNSYHSDNESPFIPSQMNNNSCESQYSSNGMHPMMEQPMPVESPLMRNHTMVNSASDSSMAVNGDNGLMQNGVDSRIMDCQITPKEEETLPKIDGPKPATNYSSSESPPKDAMKLPGFHQTFGNITEIGRFSQHDDYFETTPTPESLEPPKISDEITDVAPKRKPRGRKRKQPEPRELFSRQHQSSYPALDQQQCSEPTHHSSSSAWSYHNHAPPPPPPPPPLPLSHHHHHPSYEHHQQQYHHQQQWRSHPHQHPYYHHHHQQQHHFHHHHHYPPPPAPPPPPPSINPYYQAYSDCPPPYHYNSYSSSNWHMNRDYMTHNYSNYV